MMWIYFEKITGTEDFFHRFQVSPISMNHLYFLFKVTYFNLLSQIVAIFSRICFDSCWWSHHPFSKRKKWFPWKQFFHESVYSVHFRIVNIFFTCTCFRQEMCFREFENCKQTANRNVNTFVNLIFLTLCFLIEI